MKKIAENKWMPVVCGVLIMILGILTFIFALAKVEVVDSVVSYTIASSLFVIALIYIFASLFAHTSEFFTGTLILGSICVAIGVVFIVLPNLIGLFITYFAGALLVALGSLLLIKSILLIVYKQKGSWIAIYIIATLICLVGGILVFCYMKETKQVIYCIISIVVALAGGITLAYGIKSMNEPKDKEAKPIQKKELKRIK